MAIVVLLRHGRTSANASGILAGRAPRVGLDARGRCQARDAADRLAGVELTRVVSSPLLRCRQTARAVVRSSSGLPVVIDKDLTECDYGDWQGRALVDLAREDLWRTVQSHPSQVRFPGGETMAGMQARAVAAVRRIDADISAGGSQVWVAVSHGDVIKSILADALGLHLDLFQRIEVGPASISVVAYTPAGPRVLLTNSTAGDLSWLATAPAAAQVGGGSGPPQPRHS
ncbi:MAG: MSMEG_4193 family putative phosphomutase [Propioniciclava sp.]